MPNGIVYVGAGNPVAGKLSGGGRAEASHELCAALPDRYGKTICFIQNGAK
ncbi:hypothetical protein LGN19_17850 [Burkholderia sp. AU30198]|nr:hypothetical protein [Burkholderia sp. AU30198]